MVEWNRVKIGDVCTLEKGTTGLANANTGDYPLVATGAQRKTSKEYQFDAKAVCIPLVSSTGHGKKTLNYVHYQEGKFALGTILVAVIPKNENIISSRYLHIHLQKNKDRVLVPLMKGAANVSLSVKDIANIEIPLPSIKEQGEIINKIDSISDEHLEFLNETDVQFNLLEQLRQSTLQEATEGKLTAKWRCEHPELISGDNHASKLLENIRSEKERLIKEGKIKKEKPLAHISDDKKPFELPDGWVWCYFDDIKENKKNALKAGPFGSSLKKDCYVKHGYKIYGQEQVIANDAFIGNYYIDEKKFKELKSCEVKPGDILISLVGTIGKLLILPDGIEPGIINPRLLKISLYQAIDRGYISLLFKSPLIIDEIKSMSHGGFMDVINLGIMKKLHFPLPTIVEQKAIVDQVDKLLAFVNELEKQVSKRKEQSEMLMQSALREAFATS